MKYVDIQTATLGSHPKPDYLDTLFSWYRTKDENAAQMMAAYTEFLERLRDPSSGYRDLIYNATGTAIYAQVTCGIDVLTTGEMGSENYVYYPLRHLAGIDFLNPARRMLSNLNEADVPRVIGKIQIQEPFLARDWSIAQHFSDRWGGRRVKATVAGPFTLAMRVVDEHYLDVRSLCRAFADVLHSEVQSAVNEGCTIVQLDEADFPRLSQDALAFGLECVERVFHGLPVEVETVLHMCGGYPEYVDQEAYSRAPPQSYFDLAPAIEDSIIGQVTFEHASSPINLSLLELFSNTKVALGVVDRASNRIETEAEIRWRIQGALYHIDPDWLVVVPDCGWSMLDEKTVKLKMSNMKKGATRIPV